MKIVTDYWAKPIPTSKFDWSAVDSDTYDGAPDTHPACPIGYGATEGEAIVDLLEHFIDRCPRCGEEISDEPDGCRDPACPRVEINQMLKERTQ